MPVISEIKDLCCLLLKPCPRLPQTLPFKEMEVDRSQLEVQQEKLGEGDFGTVHKGKQEIFLTNMF